MTNEKPITQKWLQKHGFKIEAWAQQTWLVRRSLHDASRYLAARTDGDSVDHWQCSDGRQMIDVGIVSRKDVRDALRLFLRQ